MHMASTMVKHPKHCTVVGLRSHNVGISCSLHLAHQFIGIGFVKGSVKFLIFLSCGGGGEGESCHSHLDATTKPFFIIFFLLLLLS